MTPARLVEVAADDDPLARACYCRVLFHVVIFLVLPFYFVAVILLVLFFAHVLDTVLEREP